MSSNYQAHPDYQPLTERVQEALATTPTKGRRVDEFVPEDELHRYDPQLVLYVAAELGFEVDICRYGSMTRTHGQPLARANGVWVDMPSELERKFERGGEYLSQEDPKMCTACAHAYKGITDKVRRLKAIKDPSAELVKFGCFSDVVLR